MKAPPPVEVKVPAQPVRIEPRGPVALAILATLLVLALLPGRARLFPPWMPYAIGFGLLLPVIAVWWSGGRSWWLRIERMTTLVFSVAAEATTLAVLLYLVIEMLAHPAALSGPKLLASSVGAWVTNVLAFSILYWRMDRGGPEARANDVNTIPDWLFPQAGAPEEAPPGWRPEFVDYLFVAFTTATAFSPTDTLPLTRRAKILMMIESAVSLTTLVVVASRAMNILGG